MEPFSVSDATRNTADPQRSPCSSHIASPSDSGMETDTDTDPHEVEHGFSFAGGGWLMIYMYGVAKGLRERGAHKNARFIGTSAGALVAMALHLDWDLDTITENACSQYVPMARDSIFGVFRLRDYAQLGLYTSNGLDAWPKTQTHPRGCQVVYTSLSAWASRRKSTFESEDDLVNCLLASCTASPIAGLPFKYHGEWVMDGGVFDNQPLFKEEDGVKRTVVITPNCFDSAADIKPSKYIPQWWCAFPPPPDDMRWLYNLGYEDGLSWCDTNGYTSGSSSPVMHKSNLPAKAASAKQPRSSLDEYKTVLGQVVGYQSWETLGLFFSFVGKLSVYSLLKLEFTLWMLLEIVFASIDSVIITWTVVATAVFALVLAGGRMETLVIECVVVSAVYLSVCAARVYRNTHKIKNTSTRQQVKHSLQEVKRLAESISEENAHGMKAFKTYHTDLAEHHHDILMKNSLLYRISTQL